MAGVEASGPQGSTVLRPRPSPASSTMGGIRVETASSRLLRGAVGGVENLVGWQLCQHSGSSASISVFGSWTFGRKHLSRD